MTIIQHRYSLLIIFLLIICTDIFAQEKESTNVVRYFGGSVTINTKGISTIPNLTLGKPAALFAMTAGRKISFDPELRFALEGKPWTFIFWWHYQILNTKKLQVKTGINTSVYFQSVTISTDSAKYNIMSGKRSLTGDMSVSYSLGEHFTIGPYYMYVRNFDPNMTVNTHFFSLRASISNIRLLKECCIRINPQVYYLNMDKKNGFYINASLAFVKNDFPLSISALVNKTIETKIPAGKDFLWNVGLVYSFNKKYIEKQ